MQNPIKLELDKLTVGEGKELERQTGLTIGAIMNQLSGGEYSMELVSNLMLVLGRRDNPNLTMEDVDSIDLMTLEVGSVPPQTAAS